MLSFLMVFIFVGNFVCASSGHESDSVQAYVDKLLQEYKESPKYLIQDFDSFIGHPGVNIQSVDSGLGYNRTVSYSQPTNEKYQSYIALLSQQGEPLWFARKYDKKS